MIHHPLPIALKRSRSEAAALTTCLVGALLLMSADSLLATPVLDQFNGAGVSVFGSTSTDDWQQGVTAGMNGTLSSISLYSYGGPTTFKVYINLGSPWQSDANAFETEVTRPWGSGWFSIDVSAANIQLAQGDHFVIGAQGESMLWGNDNTYSGGTLWGKFGSNPPGTGPYGDLAFATYMTPVPEPSISALSLTILAGWAFRQKIVPLR
jgi:hypothetical protein